MFNKFFRLMAVILGLIAQLHAIEPSQNELQTTFGLSQGYRRDNLCIKYSQHPQSKFKHIDVYTTRLDVALRKNNFFLTAMAGYGHVYDGKMSSTSFGFSFYDYNRSYKFETHVKSKYTADFNVSMGKVFELASNWQFTPKMGYGLYIQNFHAKSPKFQRGRHGSLPDMQYKISWYSPQIGVAIQKGISENLSAYINYDFLFPLNVNTRIRNNKNVAAEDNNNSYKSFGHIAALGVNWGFAKHWQLKPEIELMKFYSREGSTSDTYNSDNVAKSIHRTSLEYRLVLSYIF